MNLSLEELKIEFRDLKDRTNKVDWFIGSPENHQVFKALPVDNQVLLRLQAKYMRDYLCILHDRMRLLGH